MKLTTALTLGLALVYLSLVPKTYAQVYPEKHMPVHRLQADLDQLWHRLEMLHPGLDSHVSKSELQDYYQALRTGLTQPMHHLEFFRYISPLVTQIRCGHTLIYPSDAYTQHRNRYHRVFPFDLDFIYGRSYVAAHFEGHTELPKGTEILAIDSIPIAELVEEIMPHLATDGFNETGKWHEIDKNFWLYLDLLYPRTQGFYITYRDRATQNEVTRFFSGVMPRIARTRERHYRQLEFQLISNTDQAFPLAYLRVSSLNKAVIEDRGQYFSKFLDNTFAEIKQQRSTTLVLDLRGNEGGHDIYGAELLQYLLDTPFQYYRELEITAATKANLPLKQRLTMKARQDSIGRTLVYAHQNLKEQKPKANAFNGKLYVLLDGGCFSATSQFLAVLHHNREATFIGEEAHGGYYTNNSGFIFEETLSHSGLVIHIPGIKYQNAVDSYPYPSSGLKPDVEIQPAYIEWLNGRDPALLKAYQLSADPNRMVMGEEDPNKI